MSMIVTENCHSYLITMSPCCSPFSEIQFNICVIQMHFFIPFPSLNHLCSWPWPLTHMWPSATLYNMLPFSPQDLSLTLELPPCLGIGIATLCSIQSSIVKIKHIFHFFSLKKSVLL